jgi:chromate transporter
VINPLVYFALFLKASLFSTGGLSNLPSLHQDLIGLGWAADRDFGEAVAIGQISPGPNGLWVVSLGYLTYGYAGAALALLAVLVPPLLVLAVAAAFARIARHRWVDGLMRGISLAVVGVMGSVCWTILRQPGADWKGLLFAGGAFALAASRRVSPIGILALAALIGLAVYRR